MVKCSLFVWSEPVSGQEEIYNEWYDKVHLADVCSLPGYGRAQRYVFDNATPTPRKYLAIYDLETDSPDTVIDTLRAEVVKFEHSPAMDMSSVIMSVVRRV